MDYKSVTIFKKPLPHISLADWNAKQSDLFNNADKKRGEAFEARGQGRTMRSETTVKTQWNTYMNNNRLEDRITELTKWSERLEGLLNKLHSEINLLKDDKFEAEKELEALNHPLQITAQCISMRDCRRDTELTQDEADMQLEKELCVIENIKIQLTERVQGAWEKLNRLEEVKFKVNLDFENKLEALKIDEDNYHLDRTCANISYKPDALKTLKNAVSYETWLENCERIKMLAETELSDVYNFREAMHSKREEARNDITGQQDLTDFTLRKRIYQTQKSRNELDWQKYKMLKEMESLRKEITNLESSILEKIDANKCAETRLENRKYRSGLELCKDQSELGLKNEIIQLRTTENDLGKSIDSAKSSYNNLELLLMRIDKNLDDKQHSLNTDMMCLDMRAALKSGDKTRLSNETDRNIVLTRMEKEIPLEIQLR